LAPGVALAVTLIVCLITSFIGFVIYFPAAIWWVRRASAPAPSAWPHIGLVWLPFAPFILLIGALLLMGGDGALILAIISGPCALILMTCLLATCFMVGRQSAPTERAN
jgi:hypothetical protein